MYTASGDVLESKIAAAPHKRVIGGDNSRPIVVFSHAPIGEAMTRLLRGAVDGCRRAPPTFDGFSLSPTVSHPIQSPIQP